MREINANSKYKIRLRPPKWGLVFVALVYTASNVCVWACMLKNMLISQNHCTWEIEKWIRRNKLNDSAFWFHIKCTLLCTRWWCNQSKKTKKTRHLKKINIKYFEKISLLLFNKEIFSKYFSQNLDFCLKRVDLGSLPLTLNIWIHYFINVS